MSICELFQFQSYLIKQNHGFILKNKYLIEIVPKDSEIMFRFLLVACLAMNTTACFACWLTCETKFEACCASMTSLKEFKRCFTGKYRCIVACRKENPKHHLKIPILRQTNIGNTIKILT